MPIITITLLNKLVRWSRRLDYVPRWSVVPTINSQSVSAHSYQVTQIARWLMEHHANGDDTEWCYDLLCAALDHDINEAAEGDAPTPSKPVAAAPDPDNQLKVAVKCADILEAIWFVEEEMVMGNVHRMKIIREELHGRLHPWWTAFKWDEKWGNKPITSDLIRAVVTMNMGFPHHPGLEET